MPCSSFAKSVAERRRKLRSWNEAISVIQSLNGSRSVTEGNTSDSNRVGRFAAQNGADSKGTMGKASEGIAVCDKD
jgi:hypothetical protein